MRNDARTIAPLDELTVAAAALESGFSQITIRRHIDKGALPVMRRGPYRRIRIKRADFDRYLNNSEVDSIVTKDQESSSHQ